MLAVVLFATAPALAEPTITVLPQAAGQRIHFRIVRTTQGTNGPESTSAVFEVVRKDPVTLTIARAGVGVPSTSTLKVGADGRLTVAEDEGLTADVPLADAVYALDAAIVAVHDATGSPHDSWAAYVPISAAKSAAVAGITFVPSNVAGAEMDFYGTGQAAAPTGAAASASPVPERGRGGRGGFGGGRGGRGRSGDESDRGSEQIGAGAIATSVHIEGHISGKHVSRIAITETRTVTVANMPFTNIASWSVTVVK